MRLPHQLVHPCTCDQQLIFVCMFYAQKVINPPLPLSLSLPPSLILVPSLVRSISPPSPLPPFHSLPFTPDACYILSFAIIMLNTSLHNANVKNKVYIHTSLTCTCTLLVKCMFISTCLHVVCLPLTYVILLAIHTHTDNASSLCQLY